MFLELTSLLASWLSLARSSTSLFFYQRLGTERDADAPMPMLILVFPAVLLLIFDLAVGWQFVSESMTPFVNFWMSITLLIFSHILLSAIMSGCYCFCNRDLLTKVKKSCPNFVIFNNLKCSICWVKKPFVNH